MSDPAAIVNLASVVADFVEETAELSTGDAFALVGAFQSELIDRVPLEIGLCVGRSRSGLPCRSRDQLGVLVDIPPMGKSWFEGFSDGRYAITRGEAKVRISGPVHKGAHLMPTLWGIFVGSPTPSFAIALESSPGPLCLARIGEEINEAAMADPDCEHCGGTGERYWHTPDCSYDHCALAGGVRDCRGGGGVSMCNLSGDEANRQGDDE